MKKLFFDIETIPCDEGMKEMFYEIKRNSYTEGELTQEILDKKYLETSFDGAFGRICCIAYIKEGDGKYLQGILKGDEKTLIQEFWKVTADANLLVGHNVFDFDIPFVIKRSIIHNIKPRFINLARFRSDSVYDTMYEWEKWAYGKKTKLDTLAKVFGLPTSKDVMDGSQVWPAYQAGKLEEICTYCMKDVQLTRKVYYRLNVEEAPPQPGSVTTPRLIDDIPF